MGPDGDPLQGALAHLREQAVDLFAVVHEEERARVRRFEDEKPSLQSLITSLTASQRILEEEKKKSSVAGAANRKAVAKAEKAKNAAASQSTPGLHDPSADVVDIQVALIGLNNRVLDIDFKIAKAKEALASSQRGDEMDVFSTSLVVMQDTKRLLKEEIKALRGEIFRIENETKCREERKQAEDDGMAELVRLEEAAARTAGRIDRVKMALHFPEAKGYRFTTGGGGVYCAAKDLCVAEVSGRFELSVEAFQTPTGARSARISLVLGGVSAGGSTGAGSGKPARASGGGGSSGGVPDVTPGGVGALLKRQASNTSNLRTSDPAAATAAAAAAAAAATGVLTADGTGETILGNSLQAATVQIQTRPSQDMYAAIAEHEAVAHTAEALLGRVEEGHGLGGRVNSLLSHGQQTGLLEPVLAPGAPGTAGGTGVMLQGEPPATALARSTPTAAGGAGGAGSGISPQAAVTAAAAMAATAAAAGVGAEAAAPAAAAAAAVAEASSIPIDRTDPFALPNPYRSPRGSAPGSPHHAHVKVPPGLTPEEAAHYIANSAASEHHSSGTTAFADAASGGGGIGLPSFPTPLPPHLAPLATMAGALREQPDSAHSGSQLEASSTAESGNLESGSVAPQTSAGGAAAPASPAAVPSTPLRAPPSPALSGSSSQHRSESPRGGGGDMLKGEFVSGFLSGLSNNKNKLKSLFDRDSVKAGSSPGQPSSSSEAAPSSSGDAGRSGERFTQGMSKLSKAIAGKAPKVREMTDISLNKAKLLFQTKAQQQAAAVQLEAQQRLQAYQQHQAQGPKPPTHNATVHGPTAHASPAAATAATATAPATAATGHSLDAALQAMVLDPAVDALLQDDYFDRAQAVGGGAVETTTGDTAMAANDDLRSGSSYTFSTGTGVSEQQGEDNPSVHSGMTAQDDGAEGGLFADFESMPGRKGVYVQLLAEHVELVGERGTKVPDMAIAEIFLEVEASCSACFEYSPVAGWRAPHRLAFHVLRLEHKMKGNSIPLPKAALKALLNAILPGLLTKAITAALPVELGDYVIASQETLQISGELKLVGPSLSTFVSDLLPGSIKALDGHKHRVWLARQAAAANARAMLGITEQQALALVQLLGFGGIGGPSSATSSTSASSVNTGGSAASTGAAAVAAAGSAFASVTQALGLGSSSNNNSAAAAPANTSSSSGRSSHGGANFFSGGTSSSSSLTPTSQALSIRELCKFHVQHSGSRMWSPLCNLMNRALQALFDACGVPVSDRFAFSTFMDTTIAQLVRKPVRVAFTLDRLNLAIDADVVMTTVRDYFGRVAKEYHKKAGEDGSKPPVQETLEVQLENLSLWHQAMQAKLRTFKTRFRSAGCTLMASAGSDEFQFGAESVVYEGPLRLKLPLDVMMDADNCFMWDIQLPKRSEYLNSSYNVLQEIIVSLAGEQDDEAAMAAARAASTSSEKPTFTSAASFSSLADQPPSFSAGVGGDTHSGGGTAANSTPSAVTGNLDSNGMPTPSASAVATTVATTITAGGSVVRDRVSGDSSRSLLAPLPMRDWQKLLAEASPGSGAADVLQGGVLKEPTIGQLSLKKIALSLKLDEERVKELLEAGANNGDAGMIGRLLGCYGELFTTSLDVGWTDILLPRSASSTSSSGPASATPPLSSSAQDRGSGGGVENSAASSSAITAAAAAAAESRKPRCVLTVANNDITRLRADVDSLIFQSGVPPKVAVRLLHALVIGLALRDEAPGSYQLRFTDKLFSQIHEYVSKGALDIMMVVSAKAEMAGDRLRVMLTGDTQSNPQGLTNVCPVHLLNDVSLMTVLDSFTLAMEGQTPLS